MGGGGGEGYCPSWDLNLQPLLSLAPELLRHAIDRLSETHITTVLIIRVPTLAGALVLKYLAFLSFCV